MLSKRNHFQAEDLRSFEDLEIFPGRTTNKIKENIYWLTNFVLFHVVTKLQVTQHQTLKFKWHSNDVTCECQQKVCQVLK